MKKKKAIHGLDSLDSEISRLQSRLGEKERQLAENLAYLEKNYVSMIARSLFSGEKKQHGHSFAGRLRDNEYIRPLVSGIAGDVAERAAESLSKLVKDLLTKKEKHDE